MGGQQSVQYARFIPGTNETPGFSDELVNINCKDQNDLVTFPYDDVKTVWDAFQRSVRLFPNNDFLGTRDDSQDGRPYVWKTWAQVDQIVQNLARGYQALDLTPEIEAEGKKWKFMGIYAKNREEWVMTDFASMANRGTSVAFYDTLGPETVEFVINQTGLTSISCSSNYIEGLLGRKKLNKAESLKNIVAFDKVDEKLREECKQYGLNVYTFQEVQEAGAAYTNYTKSPPETDDIYMFCYTSGTTGTPKAAMLTHGNLLASATSTRSVIDPTEEDCMISYLPLAHSFEKCLFTLCCIRSIKIGYYSGDPLKLMDDLQALKPTYFPSVPRLFNRIYDVINQKIRTQPGYKQMLITRAVNTKIYYLERGATYTHFTYDKLVMNTMKNMIGGRVKIMVTGSAPISGDVLKFLKVCFCAPILEGYGQTETSAASTITKQDDPEVGHVGGPLECLKIKLRDIPEMSYLHTDEDPRGEVCFKGPSVFQGYFKNEEKTKEAFTEDGWLLSGDVGKIFKNGSVKIVDRAKNIFKLAQGEYIAPEKLENVYILSQYVSQVYVHGDSLQSYLVSIVVVDKKEIQKYAQEQSVDISDDDKLLKDPKITQLIKDDFNKLAAQYKFSGLEKIKQVHLSFDPFTIEDGLLTPTMKIKRNEAQKRFADVIAHLYTLPLK